MSIDTVTQELPLPVDHHARRAGASLRPFAVLIDCFAYFTVSATHTAPLQFELVDVACCTLVPFEEYAETTTEYVPEGVP